MNSALAAALRHPGASMSFSRRLGDMALAVLDTTEYVNGHYRGHMITRVNVPRSFRGQGVGRALLSECLWRADLHRLPLYIGASAYADSPMDNAALTAWYTRAGFEPFMHGLLCRQPGSTHVTALEEVVAQGEAARQHGARGQLGAG